MRGDIKFVPQRDIEYKQEITDEDRTIPGKDVPDFTYGVNLSLQYKGFEFSKARTRNQWNESSDSIVYGVHPFYHGQDSPRKYHLKKDGRKRIRIHMRHILASIQQVAYIQLTTVILVIIICSIPIISVSKLCHWDIQYHLQQ
ncbi:hypothetical protein NXW72_23215, partial [Bacteroides fragilis]|nr:hypothetical protein [Bacteroides fragilis]